MIAHKNVGKVLITFTPRCEKFNFWERSLASDLPFKIMNEEFQIDPCLLCV